MLSSLLSRTPFSSSKEEPLPDLRVATAADLQRDLASGSLTSVQLVNACLDQIKKYDGYLHAIISRPRRRILTKIAQRLDDERKQVGPRGKLHGIPILIKDNIATLPNTHTSTTAGSLALVGSIPKHNADVVERILEAGGIIIGKTNMSELNSFKGTYTDSGWSAIGGQTQSAYVRGGFRQDDTFVGHSNPSGSSSGSAVGVTAGYAPISIGTETEGSLILPASRAALYTMKPTIPIISREGIIPLSRFCDSIGPMTKSVEDLANLMDILVDKSKTQVPSGGYISAVTAVWEGIKIGTLKPSRWTFPEVSRRVEPSADQQMKDETLKAYEKLRNSVSHFRGNITLIPDAAFVVEGENCLAQIFACDFKREFETYLKQLTSSRVDSLKSLIQFNKDNAKIELPPRNPNQDLLERAARIDPWPRMYDGLVDRARLIARTRGVDEVFREYDVNVIIGPAESSMTQFAAAAGYPIASLPLGYLDFNGRPHGLAAIAGAHQEALLIQLQSAWEATFPERRPPDLGWEGARSKWKVEEGNILLQRV